MQEALDNSLTPESLQELRTRLDQDAEESAQYQRLRHVDRLLRSAPFERAPQTLALKIIARLAEGLDPQQLTRSSGLALALALALVTLMLLPLMASIGWLILNTLGNAAALSAVIAQIAGVLSALIGMLQGLVTGAQTVLDTYPELPVVVFITTPIALFSLLRFAASTRQNRKQD
jgi:hypothetical protein